MRPADRSSRDEAQSSAVVARAPARVSLAGGGTDLPAYYERHGGAVVSFSVDRYAYAEIRPRPAHLELLGLDDGSRELIAGEQWTAHIRPPILAEEFLLYQKAVAWHFGLERAHVAVRSEVPAGAGLASSSAVCVALVRAAAAFVGVDLDPGGVAETAFRIEADVLRRPAGKQDPYASAFGGLNLIEFAAGAPVTVTPLRVSPETLVLLQRRILLFSTGARRSAVAPLAEQVRRSSGDPETVRALHRLKETAYALCRALQRGDVDAIGGALHEGWLAKQQLNSMVARPDIVKAYAAARAAGAAGGKLAGAGAGGTLVLYCREEWQEEVRRTLERLGWRRRRAEVEDEGASLRTDVGALDDRTIG